MNIVLFERDALGWSTRVFVDELLFNKIAAELFDKNHEVRTMMLSSKNETVMR